MAICSATAILVPLQIDLCADCGCEMIVSISNEDNQLVDFSRRNAQWDGLVAIYSAIFPQMTLPILPLLFILIDPSIVTF